LVDVFDNFIFVLSSPPSFAVIMDDRRSADPSWGNLDLEFRAVP